MLSSSPEETRDFAKTLAEKIPPGSIVTLEGDLGAGKTTIAKAVIEHLTGLPERVVTSPTFIYLNTYDESDIPIYHFDLYRLKSAKDFLAMGFSDYLDGETGICLIEWPKRIQEIIPPSFMRIVITHLDETTRKIDVL